MSVPDDDLTYQGSADARTLLLACGALAREVLALINANGWQHMDLHCLPANLHLYPDRIPDAVEAAVTKYRSKYNDIFVLYADCGTGGLLQNRCKSLNVPMLAGPHCYSFFDGNDAFAERAEVTSFYLTDFLVRQFDAFIIKPLGLDKHPQLRDEYFGNYKNLVYLAQTDDPALDAKAADAADRLNLPYVRRFTGYGDLARELSTHNPRG